MLPSLQFGPHPSTGAGSSSDPSTNTPPGFAAPTHPPVSRYDELQVFGPVDNMPSRRVQISFDPHTVYKCCVFGAVGYFWVRDGTPSLKIAAIFPDKAAMWVAFKTAQEEGQVLRQLLATTSAESVIPRVLSTLGVVAIAASGISNLLAGSRWRISDVFGAQAGHALGDREPNPGNEFTAAEFAIIQAISSGSLLPLQAFAETDGAGPLQDYTMESGDVARRI